MNFHLNGLYFTGGNREGREVGIGKRMRLKMLGIRKINILRPYAYFGMT